MLRCILRLEKAALMAVLLSYITSYSIQQHFAVMSMSTNSILDNGATTISQECLPRRQRKIDVTEVSIVCDHQQADDDQSQSEDNNDDRISYTNRPSCMTGDLGKVAIGCK